jgi:hypothetical protein
VVGDAYTFKLNVRQIELLMMLLPTPQVGVASPTRYDPGGAQLGCGTILM